jgi:hypothetical protein
MARIVRERYETHQGMAYMQERNKRKRKERGYRRERREKQSRKQTHGPQQHLIVRDGGPLALKGGET